MSGLTSFLEFTDNGTNPNIFFEILGTNYGEDRGRGVSRVSEKGPYCGTYPELLSVKGYDSTTILLLGA